MKNFESKHILHIAKRRIITPAEMSCLLQNDTNTNGFIGALPKDVIKDFPDFARADITRKADFIFSDFARSAACIRVTSDSHYSYYNESFKRYFPPIICGLNELLNRGDVSISYIGSGGYKHCFLLSFGNNSTNRYVLQTFQNIINFDSENFPHGVLWEPQNYFSIYKQYSHGRIAKPFMARPSSMEVLSPGYILVKYIDSNHPYKTRLGNFTILRTKVTNTDVMGRNNNISGITVDAGGFIKNPEHIAEQKTHCHWHQLAQIFDNMNFSTDLFDVYSTFDNIYTHVGDNEFFNTINWPKFLRHINRDKRDVARKTLKSLHHLKQKCAELSCKNDWETVQEYITADLKHVLLYNYGNFKYRSKIIDDILRVKQR